MTYHRTPKSAYSVYFARAGDMMKIGCSVDPRRRLTQIGEWVPFEIELVAVIPGAFDLESDLHALFADSWSHLEWFHITPAMLDLVERLASGDAVEIPKRPRNRGKELRKTLKKRATRRITVAENKAFDRLSYPERELVRPQYLKEAIKSYEGPHKQPPSQSALDAIARYERECELRASERAA